MTGGTEAYKRYERMQSIVCNDPDEDEALRASLFGDEEEEGISYIEAGAAFPLDDRDLRAAPKVVDHKHWVFSRWQPEVLHAIALEKWGNEQSARDAQKNRQTQFKSDVLAMAMVLIDSHRDLPLPKHPFWEDPHFGVIKPYRDQAARRRLLSSKLAGASITVGSGALGVESLEELSSFVEDQDAIDAYVLDEGPALSPLLKDIVDKAFDTERLKKLREEDEAELKSLQLKPAEVEAKRAELALYWAFMDARVAARAGARAGAGAGAGGGRPSKKARR